MKAMTIELHFEGGDIMVVSSARVIRICQYLSEQPAALRLRWIRKIPDRPLDYAFPSHGDMFRTIGNYESAKPTKPGGP